MMIMIRMMSVNYHHHNWDFSIQQKQKRIVIQNAFDNLQTNSKKFFEKLLLTIFFPPYIQNNNNDDGDCVLI